MSDPAHPAPAAKKDDHHEEKKPAPKKSFPATLWAIGVSFFILIIAVYFGAEFIRNLWDGIILSIQNFFTGSAIAIDSTRIGLHNNNAVGIGLRLELTQTINLFLSYFFLIFFGLLFPYVGWKLYEEHKAKQKPAEPH